MGIRNSIQVGLTLAISKTDRNKDIECPNVNKDTNKSNDFQSFEL